MLREACRQLRAWQAEGLGLSSLAVKCLAGNSGRRASSDGSGRSSGRRHRADCLELEITESLLIDANSGVADMLDELRNMGITLSLDDFGTGYSSLAYLKRFQVESVKIDRSFVTELEGDEGSGAIAAAIVAMAHALRKRVVAEGVETERQAAHPRGLGCDDIQGYYVSRPMSARHFAQFMRMAGTRERRTALPPKRAAGA